MVINEEPDVGHLCAGLLETQCKGSPDTTHYLVCAAISIFGHYALGILD